MNSQKYITTYIALVAAQILLCVCFGFRPYLVWTVLPLAIMSLPQSVSTSWGLVIAFVTGIVVDFFATGTIGLYSASLLPLALARKNILRLVASDLVSFTYSGSPFSRLDITKSAIMLLISCALFVLVFSIVETAGARSFWFIFFRMILSSLPDTLLCLLLGRILYSNVF